MRKGHLLTILVSLSMALCPFKLKVSQSQLISSPHLAHCFSGSPDHRKGHFALCLASRATGKMSHCALGFLGKEKEQTLTTCLPLD